LVESRMGVEDAELFRQGLDILLSTALR